MSFSLASATSFSSLISVKSSGLISGINSTERLNSKSLPSSKETTSMFGWAAGRSPRSSRVFCDVSFTDFSKTSPKRDWPNLFFTSAGGTLPGLKPGSWRVGAISFRRSSTLLSISEAEIITLNSLFKPSVIVSVTSINLSDLIHLPAG